MSSPATAGNAPLHAPRLSPEQRAILIAFAIGDRAKLQRGIQITEREIETGQSKGAPLTEAEISEKREFLSHLRRYTGREDIQGLGVAMMDSFPRQVEPPK